MSGSCNANYWNLPCVETHNTLCSRRGAGENIRAESSRKARKFTAARLWNYVNTNLPGMPRLSITQTSRSQCVGNILVAPRSWHYLRTRPDYQPLIPAKVTMINKNNNQGDRSFGPFTYNVPSLKCLFVSEYYRSFQTPDHKKNYFRKAIDKMIGIGAD